MKINEVRELSTSELKEKLYSLKEQLFELRRKKAVGALERGEDVITVRKDIARVNMVLRERELAENKSGGSCQWKEMLSHVLQFKA